MLAYKTETQQGKMLRISCSDSRELITSQYDDALAFLIQPTDKDMAVVFHIDAFVDDITSLMPKDLSKKVKDGGRVFTTDKRKLYYQPNRMFGVNHTNIYGLNRYSDDKIDDCQELLSLAKKVVKAYETFGVKVNKLSSPIAVYSQNLDNLDYPRACDLPDSAFPMLEKCGDTMTREWRDVFTLGHFEAEEISDYDVVACYPSIVAELPDISNATFFESNTMPDNYFWGVMYGKLRIDKPVSPFICQEKNCYPIGEWYDTITTDELWLLRKYEIGDFTMEQGSFFLLPEVYGYPFKATMNKLYKQRSSRDELVSKIAKGISVGLIGKLAERYEERLGDNCNPIYSKMATSRAMVKVASFIYHNNIESSIVSVLVDGFLATKRLPIKNKKEMGSWKINDPPMPALVLSLEYQWQGDKRPAYQTYETMMGMIKDNPNKPNYDIVDINLIHYNRKFEKLPKTGRELISDKYYSTPYEINN